MDSVSSFQVDRSLAGQTSGANQVLYRKASRLSCLSISDIQSWSAVSSGDCSRFCSGQNLTLQQLSTLADFSRLNLKEFREECPDRAPDPEPVFPSIENDVKELYAQRSAFVHGSFFANIAKESKRAFNNLPTPDFKLLLTHKHCLRWALVAYLHLAQVMKTQPKRFGQAKNVMSALEQAIIDVSLRNDLLSEAKNVFSLMAR